MARNRPIGTACCLTLDGIRHVFNDDVSDVSYAGIAMRVDILGQERRRRWRDDEKPAIVMSVGDAWRNHQRGCPSARYYVPAHLHLA